jgi:hypothetical protein
MDYKTRIFLLKLSRKVLCARLGLTYSAFTARLNNFINWQGDEERILQEILTQAEVAQKTEAEKNAEDVVYRGWGKK